jgi:hypothetical protein
MTLSIADFRNFAKRNSDDYIARDDVCGGFKLQSKAEWNRHRTNWHASASNEARRNFIVCLKREYPQIAALIDKEIAPYLSQNGRPLKSWHVREVLDRVDRMLEADKATIRDPRMLVAKPELCLDSDGMKYFEDQLQPAEKVTSSGEPPVNLNVAREQFARDYEELQGDVEQSLIVGEPGAGKHELTLKEPELVIFRPPAATSGVPQAAPQAAPPVAKPPTAPPRQPRGMNPASFDRSRAQAQWDGSKLKRTDSKGKEPEEPRAEPKRTDAGNPQAAKVIQDTAWRDLSPLFKGIEKHVASAQDEAAKPLLGKSKKKAQIEAPETEDKFRLIGGEIAFADLFVKPPNFGELDQFLAKHAGTTTPLSVYFDLLKTTGEDPPIVGGFVRTEPGKHWLFRMRNAETKLDAEQVIREIDAFIEQLGMEIARVEYWIDNPDSPVSKSQLKQLEDVAKRLRSINEGLRDSFSPLLDLKARCRDLVEVLPDEPPRISTHFQALDAFQQMGIEADSHSDTTALVTMANRMMKVHNLLHRGLLEGKTWQDLYDDPKSDKTALSEYREKRLTGVKRLVSEQTDVEINFADDKGKKIYYFATEASDAERQARFWQASYVLGMIALSMGDTERLLKNVFGYGLDLDYENRVLAERAKEQAATA